MKHAYCRSNMVGGWGPGYDQVEHLAFESGHQLLSEYSSNNFHCECGRLRAVVPAEEKATPRAQWLRGHCVDLWLADVDSQTRLAATRLLMDWKSDLDDLSAVAEALSC